MTPIRFPYLITTEKEIMSIDKLIIEEWRPIEGFEGYYEISNIGRVKSLQRREWWEKRGCYHLLKERIMKTFINRKGYVTVQLKKQSERTKYSVHRLVAFAFINNPSGFPEINHKDCIRDNNVYSNLEWVTHSKNQEYAYQSGNRSHKGSKHPQVKLSESQVREIRSKYVPFIIPAPLLAREYNVTVGCINNIVGRRTWKHI